MGLGQLVPEVLAALAGAGAAIDEHGMRRVNCKIPGVFPKNVWMNSDWAIVLILVTTSRPSRPFTVVGLAKGIQLDVTTRSRLQYALVRSRGSSGLSA